MFARYSCLDPGKRCAAQIEIQSAIVLFLFGVLILNNKIGSIFNQQFNGIINSDGIGK
ncbi:MAG TPA: hypothetical protein PL020_04725 [Candidatus Cloacimonadota bacterium]|nr:hypothetical protein [Candidatus Cloacimonadota bacterium]